MQQKYNISVVPLKVFFGSESYLDGVDLKAGAFYKKLVTSKELPTTSQPSPNEFAEHYSKWLDQGMDIVSIHISSLMSGTIQSAQLAKSMLGHPGLEVIDPQAVSVHLGMMVLAAARAAQAGLSRTEVVAVVKRIMAEHQIYFMVETLEYLQRGGRIGKGAAFLGTILNIKPVLTIREGMIHPHEKIRGRKKAIARLVQLVQDHYRDAGPLFTFLTHGNDPQGLATLEQLVREKLDCQDMLQAQMGAVVGTHVGPDIVGIATCPQKLMNF